MFLISYCRRIKETNKNIKIVESERVSEIEKSLHQKSAEIT
jgi:hypothetical protein